MAEKVFLPGGIKERLEDLRNRRKLTLKDVSEKTGIDYSTLSRIENGNVKKVGDDALLKLARFFGVSTDFLLGITDVPDKKNYTIEELCLTPDSARNLYSGAVDSRVINLLLEHPDFGTLTNRIADYLDDRMAAGIAAQNQLSRKRRLCVGSSMRTNSRKLKPCLSRFFPPSKKSIRLASRRRRKL